VDDQARPNEGATSGSGAAFLKRVQSFDSSTDDGLEFSVSVDPEGPTILKIRPRGRARSDFPPIHVPRRVYIDANLASSTAGDQLIAKLRSFGAQPITHLTRELIPTVPAGEFIESLEGLRDAGFVVIEARRGDIMVDLTPLGSELAKASS
jgi:hypothetical protein